MINTENERLLTANQNQHHLNTNQNDNENDSLVSSSDNGSDTSKQNTTKKGSKYQKKEDEIIFGGRFECNRNLLLGSGTFGEIYFGIDTLQKEYVAVKLEKPTAKEPQLRNEKMILDLMNEVEGFPKTYDFGTHLDSTFMAMELLGPSTNDLFLHCRFRFSLQTVLLLAIQMIERIQELHNKNYIHRDIKPENFTLGLGVKSNTLYLIDFGLCKKYKDTKTMEHIIYRETREITGTPRYASINNHLGIEQSRRDDLEGIAYVLIYFLKRRLPWQNIEGKTNKERYKKILEKKLSIPIELLCKDLPVEFSMFLSYARGLRYDERPDYNFLKGMFTELLSNTYYEEYVFDWALEKPSEIPNKKKKNLLGKEQDEDKETERSPREGSKQFRNTRLVNSSSDILEHSREEEKEDEKEEDEDGKRISEDEGSDSGDTEEINLGDIGEQFLIDFKGEHQREDNYNDNQGMIKMPYEKKSSLKRADSLRKMKGVQFSPRVTENLKQQQHSRIVETFLNDSD